MQTKIVIFLYNLNIFILFLSLFFPFSIYISFLKPIFAALTIFLIFLTGTRFAKPAILLAFFGISTFLAYSANIDICNHIAFQSQLLWAITGFIFITDFLSYKKNTQKQNMVKAMLLIVILYLVFSVLSKFIDNSLIFDQLFAFTNPVFNVPLYYHPEILGAMLSVGLVLITFQIKAGIYRLMYTLFFILTAMTMLHLSPVAGVIYLFFNTALLLKYGYGNSNIKSLRCTVLITVVVLGIFSLMFEDVSSLWQKYAEVRRQKFFEGFKIFSRNPVRGSGGNSFEILSKCNEGKSIFQESSISKNYSNSYNLFMELASSCGIITFSILIIFLLVTFQSSRKHRISFISHILIIFVFGAFTEDVFLNNYYQVFLCIIISVYLSEIEDKKIICTKMVNGIIYILLIVSLAVFILDYGNRYGSIIRKIVLKAESLDKMKAGLSRALDFSPMNPDIYNDLAELSILGRKYDEAENSLSTALQYSPHNIRSMRYKCWVSFFKKGDNTRIMKLCMETDPVDKYGVTDMLECQIKFSSNKLEKSSVSLFFYLLRYPEFCNDIFLKMNPILKENVKKIVYNEKKYADLIDSFAPKGFIKLRISEIYFFMGDYSSALKLFKSIDLKDTDIWDIDDKDQIAHNFKKEYQIMKIKLGLCSENELHSLFDCGNDEILNSLIIYLFSIKKYNEVLLVADKFLESRRVKISPYVIDKLKNEGLYYAVLSAIAVKNKIKAEEFSESLLSEKNSWFLSYLSKAQIYAFLNEKKLALNELNKFMIAVTSKKHPFQKNRILNLFLEINDEWIKDRKFPIGVYNFSRYIKEMLDIYGEILEDGTIKQLDLKVINDFFAPLLKNY